MKRKMTTLIALAITCLLGFCAPNLPRQASHPESTLQVTRIWLLDIDPAAAKWVRKQAAAYEKETGERLYLRSATQEEAMAAQKKEENTIVPDLMVLSGENSPLCYLGYALILRDETAPVMTPVPTSALFYPSTPTPGPSPTPAPAPDWQSISPILAPESLSVSLNNTLPVSNPLADFSAKKAPAALLTAGQASTLSFGYQAYSLPDNEGFETISAHFFTEAGEDFFLFLQSASAQLALKDHGLYSALPSLRLYGKGDPLRMLIESSLRH